MWAEGSGDSLRVGLNNTTTITDSSDSGGTTRSKPLKEPSTSFARTVSTIASIIRYINKILVSACSRASSTM